MKASPNLPPPAEPPCLSLAEVLEQEFLQLHGARLAPAAPSEEPGERLRAIWAAIHGLEEKRTALCISGGGIRSATFAFGVLQGLARCGLLGRFHYLSTVSGGGYIGSWLTAWIARAGGGVEEVMAQLSTHTEARPNPEAAEIRNLRTYSNYLSPKLGFLSADAWTLGATYGRNLVLTWMVILPLLAAALSVPWLYIGTLMADPAPYTSVPLWAGMFFAAVAVAFMGRHLPCGGNKRGTQRDFLRFCLAPLLLAAICLTADWAWFTRYGGKVPAWRFLGLGAASDCVPFLYLGMGMHLVAWLGSLLRAHGFKLKEFAAVLVSGALGGWLLWLAAEKLFPQPIATAELYCCLAVPLFLGLFMFAITAFAGLSSRWTKDEDREWWGRSAGWLLIALFLWAGAGALVMFGQLLLQYTVTFFTSGSLAGLCTILAGRSAAVPANPKQAEKASTLGLLAAKAAPLAALVFAVLLLILLSAATTLLMKQLGGALHFSWNLQAPSGLIGRPVEYINILLYAPVWPVVWLTMGLALVGLGMAGLIDPNKFSLHAMYRDRLIRAYPGASNPARTPNPFTGFDEQDNLRMHELWQPEKSDRKLLHVINIALNLVSGSALAMQERKATSFTVSPLHCGAGAVGYRPTKIPGGLGYGGSEGISLGTAVTISGAAASPNMGYHSSPLVTFILTLLNVRLGAWLGNPGPAGAHTFQLPYPRFSVKPLLAETLGLTDGTSPYVYLSDGGHFENLGLYEMVLRRCHCIVVSDAGQDPDCFFEDLGGAVRKIRIDLGISISFDQIDIYARTCGAEETAKGRNCAVGRIRYAEVDGPGAEDGVLIYLKPACYGQEPRDIYEYFKRSQDFPHESTLNQFFTESQFESYRMLGLYTMERLCPKPVSGFPEFVRQVFQGHLKIPPPSWLEGFLGTPAAEERIAEIKEHTLKERDQTS